MSVSGLIMSAARNYLPTPFTIAVLLTLLTFALAGLLTAPDGGAALPYWLQLLGFWERGFWNLLEFAMQMMLMLVLGHVLALTPQADALIRLVVRFCNTSVRAAAIVTLLAVTVGLINWGLALIFGAILARKVGEAAYRQDISINYPLVGAAGYAGLMVWHGGLSGSAPLKVADANHFLVERIGQIPLTETLFSTMNLLVAVAFLILLPVGMAVLARRTAPTPLSSYMAGLAETAGDSAEPLNPHQADTPARRLDHSVWLARLFGVCFLLIAVYRLFIEPDRFSLNALSLNLINFLLLGTGILLYGNLGKYAAAVGEATTGAAGILLQFPLYAGIAGIMQYSGLLAVFAHWLSVMATPLTYPFWVFVSAAVVNVFVPSGGGQWAVQGPIIAEAAASLGVSYSKSVMALAYGDQLTNMVQPFWAIPLLAITRLSAQEILPYTLFLLLMGAGIISLALLLL